MLNYLISFLQNNFYFILFAICLLLAMSVRFKSMRKLLMLGSSAAIIYLILVVLYKNGFGNKYLYEFSIHCIYMTLLILERLSSVFIVNEVFLSRIINLITSLPSDVYFNVLGASYLCLWNLECIKKPLIFIADLAVLGREGFTSFAKNKIDIFKNISTFSFVLRC